MGLVERGPARGRPRELLNNANATTLINTTSYPDDQSLGSTWNPSLIYKVATQISDEAREVRDNNTENLDFYSPTMNLERDPRWGRTDETYGEDPFLTSREVSQFVDGLQGETEQGQLLPAATATTRRSRRSSTSRPTTARSTG